MCVISGFCHKVDEHCVLDYYAAGGGNPVKHDSQIVNPWLLNYTYWNLYNSIFAVFFNHQKIHFQ
jgi:hypothetical protein